MSAEFSRAFVELGRILSVAELTKLIAAFEMGQSCAMAAKQLSGSKMLLVSGLLDDAGLSTVSPRYRAGLCSAIMAAKRQSQAEIETVWTMPEGIQVAGLSTTAMFHEIGKAKESILASTFNIQLKSNMVQSLRRAAIRGVAVTLMATPGGKFGPAKGMWDLAIQLSHEIPGCKLLTLADQTELSYQVLHSKFLVVDSEWAFVGSANFSDAASSKNVELGVQVRSSNLARKIHSDIQSFEAQGILVSARRDAGHE